MRVGRKLFALLLLPSAAAVIVWLLMSSWPQSAQQRSLTPNSPPSPPPPSASSQKAFPSPAQLNEPHADLSSGSFAERLRCTQFRFFLHHAASPDVLRLLCARRPLSVVKIETPLAEAGDPHAIQVLGFIGNDGQCDLLVSSRPPATLRPHMLEVARRNGATAQTLGRLDALLAEEEPGPSGEELAACRQAADVLAKLKPGLIRQIASALGRSLEKLRGEDELDVGIEYTRAMLVHGDAESEEDLARLLLDKRTPESQTEAVTLLREAARTSPSAKTALATCLLQGCPTPAPDPTEARRLLTEAATAGDLLALMALAGPRDPTNAALDPNLPAPERYAWAQFLQRLHEEGCFGATDYSAWATFPGQRPSLLAMSPADAASAQMRAAELLGEQLGKTRALLGCDEPGGSDQPGSGS